MHRPGVKPAILAQQPNHYTTEAACCRLDTTVTSGCNVNLESID